MAQHGVSMDPRWITLSSMPLHSRIELIIQVHTPTFRWCVTIPPIVLLAVLIIKNLRNINSHRSEDRKTSSYQLDILYSRVVSEYDFLIVVDYSLPHGNINASAQTLFSDALRFEYYDVNIYWTGA